MTLKYFAFAGAIAFGTAAYSQDVGYNFDKEADFAKYKTYKWVELKGGQDKLDQINANNVVAAFDRDLAAKGLTKTDSDPDLYVGYQVGHQANQQFDTYNMGGGPWGWGGGWGGMGMSQTTSSTIITGTLVLDMYDVASKKLIWRGHASKTVDPNAKPDKRLKNINKAVDKMMKNYPPKIKS